LCFQISEIVMALKLSNEPTNRPVLQIDIDSCADTDGDWLDDLNDDDDSTTEDSDDDSLNNKLCTFTQTHKEFMNQHWYELQTLGFEIFFTLSEIVTVGYFRYHCHTCKMVDGVGVCTVCAPVCHAGHDVTYSKHGSFFCDCGAKEDGSCIALTKRSSNVVNERRAAAQSIGTNAYDPNLPSRRRGSVSANVSVEKKPDRENTPKASKDDSSSKRRIKLSKLLGDLRHYLVVEIMESHMVQKLVDILEELLPAIQNQSEKVSSLGTAQAMKWKLLKFKIFTFHLGRLSRLQDSLNLLHEMPKTTKYTEWVKKFLGPTLKVTSYMFNISQFKNKACCTNTWVSGGGF